MMVPPHSLLLRCVAGPERTGLGICSSTMFPSKGPTGPGSRWGSAQNPKVEFPVLQDAIYPRLFPRSCSFPWPSSKALDHLNRIDSKKRKAEPSNMLCLRKEGLVDR